MSLFLSLPPPFSLSLLSPLSLFISFPILSPSSLPSLVQPRTFHGRQCQGRSITAHGDTRVKQGLTGYTQQDGTAVTRLHPSQRAILDG